MKKNELKKVLKPIIKECIQDMIINEGFLIQLIKEVSQPAQTIPPYSNPIATPDGNPVQMRPPTISETPNQPAIEKLSRMRSQIQEQIGIDAYDSLDLGPENTPITEVKKVGKSGLGDLAGTPGAQNVKGPLAGMDPSDAGVSIDGLFKHVGKKWNMHMDADK